MATIDTAARARVAAEAAEFRRPARSLWRDAWHQFTRHRLAMGGLVTIIFLVVVTLIGPFLWPVPFEKLDYSNALLPMSPAHPFGTDDLGHDLFARALWGGRVSIAVGIVAVLIAISLGTVVGAISGFFGGQIDNVLMRLTDMFLSLPQLPLLLLTIFLFREPLRALFGPELGIFLSLKQKEFVEAARSIGAPNKRIIVTHILPNVLSPVLVAGSVGIGAAIITESALSFLGLGFPSDVPTWGRMLYDSQNYIDIAPHWAIFPGVLIFLTVLSINYVGDGLRDALDPRKSG